MIRGGSKEDVDIAAVDGIDCIRNRLARRQAADALTGCVERRPCVFYISDADRGARAHAATHPIPVRMRIRVEEERRLCLIKLHIVGSHAAREVDVELSLEVQNGRLVNAVSIRDREGHVDESPFVDLPQGDVVARAWAGESRGRLRRRLIDDSDRDLVAVRVS